MKKTFVSRLKQKRRGDAVQSADWNTLIADVAANSQQIAATRPYENIEPIQFIHTDDVPPYSVFSLTLPDPTYGYDLELERICGVSTQVSSIYFTNGSSAGVADIPFWAQPLVATRPVYLMLVEDDWLEVGDSCGFLPGSLTICHYETDFICIGLTNVEGLVQVIPTYHRDAILYAQAPSGGIPALTGITPGLETCTQVIEAPRSGVGFSAGDLVKTPYTQIIANWDTIAHGVDGNRVVQISSNMPKAKLVGSSCTNSESAASILLYEPTEAP